MFRHSIKWRFIIPFVLIIVAVTTLLSIYLTNRYTTAYYEDVRSSLISQANLLTTEILNNQINLSQGGELQDIGRRYGENLSVRVTIIALDGKVLAETETDPETMVNHFNRPEVQQVVNGEVGYNIRYSTTLKAQMMYVAVGLRRGEKLEGIIRLARPLSELDSRVKEIRRTFMFAAIAAVLAAFATTYFIANQTTAPLKKLTRSAKAISEGDFSYEPEKGYDNEINDLTRAFAQMSRQMQQQIATINEQKAKLERIVDRLMDGIIIVNRDGRIDLINETARSMFGVIKVTNESADFVKRLQNYQLVDLWHKTLQTGEEQNTFIDNPTQENHLFGLTTFLGSVQDGLVLILLQDRTKHRQLEEMRQTFVSNVSHELRTPLTTMKVLTETLQQCLVSDPQNAERFLDLMDVEIDKLTQMVLELLELSRIESGRVEMRKLSVNVFDLLIKPVERMRLQAERSKLELRIEVPGGLSMVQADAERMEQVLLNLIHNAIKHTPPGGEIVVTAAHIDEEIWIKVKDTGEGIAEKDIPRIFERFYKTDQARASGGTGLGLAIAKHIVEAHHGRIWVESAAGQGATFFIALPLA
jgi:two-component system phosphate regulon sensor histidine kinase PhoR